MLNSYSGLILPLIASATATFLFRQFFMTVPDELAEAARVDGARPMRFFFDILLPMSRTNIAALFVILFIYGWNQYLWPLLITTDPSMNTIVMGIKQMFPSGDDTGRLAGDHGDVDPGDDPAGDCRHRHAETLSSAASVESEK
jgi:sn-glycerol 3-phosphate transport system permease protein